MYMRLTSFLFYFYPYLGIRFLKRKNPKGFAIIRHTYLHNITLRLSRIFIDPITRMFCSLFFILNNYLSGALLQLDHLLCWQLTIFYCAMYLYLFYFWVKITKTFIYRCHILPENSHVMLRTLHLFIQQHIFQQDQFYRSMYTF